MRGEFSTDELSSAHTPVPGLSNNASSLTLLLHTMDRRLRRGGNISSRKPTSRLVSARDRPRPAAETIVADLREMTIVRVPISRDGPVRPASWMFDWRAGGTSPMQLDIVGPPTRIPSSMRSKPASQRREALPATIPLENAVRSRVVPAVPRRNPRPPTLHFPKSSHQMWNRPSWWEPSSADCMTIVQRTIVGSGGSDNQPFITCDIGMWAI